MCKFRPEKSDPNRTRITIMGKFCIYDGDVGTKTASLDLCKLFALAKVPSSSHMT